MSASKSLVQAEALQIIIGVGGSLLNNYSGTLKSGGLNVSQQITSNKQDLMRNG